MEQPPVQIGQYVLGKNLGIGAFGKVRLVVMVTQGDTQSDHRYLWGTDVCLVITGSWSDTRLILVMYDQLLDDG